MFNKPKRDSELQDLYSSEKAITDMPITRDDGGDPMYKFKRNVDLSTAYELYLQTEKSIKMEEAKAKEFAPMEVLARKIKRDERLSLKDLQYWIQYNFLVFKDTDQQQIKALVEKQQWFWKWMSILMMPLCFTGYAIMHYQRGYAPFKSMVFTGLSLYSLCQLGTMSTRKDMDKFYRELYDKYRDEVLLPQYRGLKLYDGKTMSQIDNKDMTSSQLDDLKALIRKNR